MLCDLSKYCFSDNFFDMRWFHIAFMSVGIEGLPRCCSLGEGIFGQMGVGCRSRKRSSRGFWQPVWY